jgi:RNA polymerase sigma-70 factor (ECF subfamily)
MSDAPASFATTHWSLVLAAGKRALPESSKALAALCQAYWPPVYAFVRRQVTDLHEAQDLTQAFFTQLLEKNVLAVAQPSRGRFRSFLLTSVRNFLLNEWDKRKAQKRGGGQNLFAIDFQQEDSKLSREPGRQADAGEIIREAMGASLARAGDGAFARGTGESGQGKNL